VKLLLKRFRCRNHKNRKIIYCVLTLAVGVISRGRMIVWRTTHSTPRKRRTCYHARNLWRPTRLAVCRPSFQPTCDETCCHGRVPTMTSLLRWLRMRTVAAWRSTWRHGDVSALPPPQHDEKRYGWNYQLERERWALSRWRRYLVQNCCRSQHHQMATNKRPVAAPAHIHTSTYRRTSV